MLVIHLSGASQLYAELAGHGAVDFCDDGCEGQQAESKCPPVCPTCSCGHLNRPVVQPAPLSYPMTTAACSQGAAHVGLLLIPPQRLDGGGVFRPPRA